MEQMTAAQFVVALLMSLGALCSFIWAVLSGHFRDVERAKYHAYRTEISDDDASGGRGA